MLISTGIFSSINLHVSASDGKTEIPDGYTPIYTVQDLDSIRNNLDGKYLLMNDIEFSKEDFSENGHFYNSGQGWKPIGTDDKTPFTGVLDGNGHSIKGLYINLDVKNKTVYAGLFGYSNGTINDLTMIDSNISVTVSMDSTFYKANAYAGGLVGISGGTINNCNNTGTVSATFSHHSSMVVQSPEIYAGGIAGKINGGTVSYCNNTGTVTAWSDITRLDGIRSQLFSGGITGTNAGDISYCSNNGCVNVRYDNFYLTCHTGGIAGSNSQNITYCYNTGEIVGQRIDGRGGGLTTTYAGGITGLNDNNLMNCYNIGGVIINMVDYPFAGGIAGGNKSLLNNCYNVGNVCAFSDFSPGHQSGIVAGNTGTLVNCYYLDIIEEELGNAEGILVACSEEDMRKQETFSGYDFDTVWEFSEGNSYPYPTLRAFPHISPQENTTEFAGGIGTVYQPYLVSNKMHLNNVRNYLGSCFKMTGDIEFTEADFAENGPFYNNGLGWIPIDDDGDLSAFYGIFDGNGHTVKGLFINATWMAGLFSSNCGTIQNLGVTDGYIYGNYYSGGISGYNFGSIINCYNTCEIVGESKPNPDYPSSAPPTTSHVGGIAGWNSDGTVINCYNTGNMSVSIAMGGGGGNAAGGIVGSGGNISNCYNTGNISGQGTLGGISGFGMKNTNNCYYLNNIQKGVGYGTDKTVKCTEAEMKRQETFVGFDFDSIWTMAGNQDYLYPELKNVPMQYAKSVDRIEVTAPTKTEYLEGKDELDVTGGKVTVYYDNETNEEIDLTIDMVSGFDNTQVGKQTLTVKKRVLIYRLRLI